MTKHNGNGFLRIWVTTGGQSFPILGANVEVWEPGGSRLYQLQTGPGGLTPTVELPAPAASESLTPNGSAGMRPYAVYTIRVSADGYIPVRDRSVSVFDGITAVQPVILQPLSGSARDRERDAVPIQIPRAIEEPSGDEEENEENYARPYPQYDRSGNAGDLYSHLRPQVPDQEKEELT